jgi:hypothetical protein
MAVVVTAGGALTGTGTISVVGRGAAVTDEVVIGSALV